MYSLVVASYQVDFRVGETAPARPVAEKAWLKPTGMLPLGKDPGSSFVVMHDARDAAVGGCDSPAHFDGCHVYYIKVRSRSRCGCCSFLVVVNFVVVVVSVVGAAADL